MKSDLKRLIEFDEAIQGIVKDFGLDCFPQEFDVIPAQKMLEILAYRFPINFSHWSFGRDYEMERTKYEYGYGIPYEVVLNSDPSRAYLINTNPFAVQVMVMAHVYAHNSFMKNNFYFKPTRRDILPSASESSLRFQTYEKKYGLEKVESLIDAAMSIELNINPDFFITEESEEEQLDRLKKKQVLSEITHGKFDDLTKDLDRKVEEPIDYDRKTPLEPEQDVILYIQNHSPKPLQKWEKDVLSVIRDQSRYFMPQRRTKIMNEGWASYWHIKIMDKLFREHLLNEEEHGFFNLYNARVLATNPKTINPYLVGLKIFTDIEDRWNKGQFGREWDECQDPRKKEAWDLKLGQGKEKIFSVSCSYSDRFFIEHFLTEQLVKDLELYIYFGKEEGNVIEYEIIEKQWEKIRNALVQSLSSFGMPTIYVQDGDYHGRRDLYLKHAFNGIELDEEYRKKTMENIFFLWDRPVYLETIVGNHKIFWGYDGVTHKYLT